MTKTTRKTANHPDLPAAGVLTAVVDRSRARLFETTTAGTVELLDLVSSGTRGGRFHSDRGDSPGSGEKNYHHRIAHERAMHYASVVETLERLLRERAGAGLVIAAGKGETGALRKALSPRLQSALLGAARLSPVRLTVSKVRESTLRVYAAAQRVKEQSELDRALENVGEGVLHLA